MSVTDIFLLKVLLAYAMLRIELVLFIWVFKFVFTLLIMMVKNINLFKSFKTGLSKKGSHQLLIYLLKLQIVLRMLTRNLQHYGALTPREGIKRKLYKRPMIISLLLFILLLSKFLLSINILNILIIVLTIQLYFADVFGLLYKKFTEEPSKLLMDFLDFTIYLPGLFTLGVLIYSIYFISSKPQTARLKRDIYFDVSKKNMIFYTSIYKQLHYIIDSASNNIDTVLRHEKRITNILLKDAIIECVHHVHEIEKEEWFEYSIDLPIISRIEGADDVRKKYQKIKKEMLPVNNSHDSPFHLLKMNLRDIIELENRFFDADQDGWNKLRINEHYFHQPYFSKKAFHHILFDFDEVSDDEKKLKIQKVHDTIRSNIHRDVVDSLELLILLRSLFIQIGKKISRRNNKVEDFSRDAFGK
ncbi:hypothetical protein EQV77_00830 [Halobacillus fulvus]|nr:hypothetical protein EQV77_00830 [Halobacillus fulvus]